MSISSPALSSKASTTAAGRRIARLLPHFATCIAYSITDILLTNVYPRVIAIKAPPAGVDVAPPLATDGGATRPLGVRLPSVRPRRYTKSSTRDARGRSADKHSKK